MNNGRKLARELLTFSTHSRFSDVVAEARLTSLQKRIVHLKFNEGLLNYEIAFEFNCSPEKIDKEMKRIYDKIHKVLIS